MESTKMRGIVKNLIPFLFNWLKKQANNKKAGKLKDAGIAAVEIEQVINKIKSASQDGVIDSNEMRLISNESAEALLAVAELFGKVEIRLKNKKFK